MTEATGWTAVVIAVAAMIRGEYQAYNARQVAKDKAEADRFAALDKMEHDAKLQRLETETATCAADRASLRALSQQCAEQHRESEIDRAKLRAEVDLLKTMIVVAPAKQ